MSAEVVSKELIEFLISDLISGSEFINRRRLVKINYKSIYNNNKYWFKW
jgi:hypothetical protein